jgi:ketosteroid isomerase-like protein
MARSRASKRGATPREVFECARRSMVERDADGFADLFAPDAFLEFPFSCAAVGLPACLEGREQIRRHLHAVMAGSMEAGRRILGYDAVVLHETTDPEVIIVEFDLQGDVPRTGQSYQLPYVQVFRIRDGQILSMRDYVSAERLVEVLDLGTKPGPAHTSALPTSRTIWG